MLDYRRSNLDERPRVIFKDGPLLPVLYHQRALPRDKLAQDKCPVECWTEANLEGNLHSLDKTARNRAKQHSV